MPEAEISTTNAQKSRLGETLRKVEVLSAAVAVVALVLTSLTIILVRLLAQSSWSVSLVDTLSQYPSHLMVVAALLGGSIALTRGEALKIEVLNGLLSETNRRRVKRAVAVVGLFFFLGFLAFAVRYLSIDFRLVVAVIYLPLFLLLAFKLLLISTGKIA